MLKRLIVLLFPLFAFTAVAQEKLIENLWQGLEDFQRQLPELNEEISAISRGGEEEELELKVFVSLSMPQASIKQYFRDSAKYRATLVLKGLPEGSFVALQKFVQGLTSNGEGNLVLDEEAFERFAIEAVPTIVLACKNKADKISGNVSLQYALEQFRARGENASYAAKILEQAKK